MTGTLAGLKSYAVIEGSASDGVLNLALGGARAYLSNAGVNDPEGRAGATAGDVQLYEMALYRLAAIWYDNRGDIPEQSGAFIGLNGIIHQLKEV